MKSFSKIKEFYLIHGFSVQQKRKQLEESTKKLKFSENSIIIYNAFGIKCRSRVVQFVAISEQKCVNKKLYSWLNRYFCLLLFCLSIVKCKEAFLISAFCWLLPDAVTKQKQPILLSRLVMFSANIKHLSIMSNNSTCCALTWRYIFQYPKFT